MDTDKTNVIIPDILAHELKSHEIEVAWIAARYFNTTVEFLIPIEGYKIKTADLVLMGHIWEIKSPKGKSKTTVGNQFKRAAKQSKYLIFDARRTSIPDDEVMREVKRELAKRRSIKQLLFINKAGTLLEIIR